MKHDKTALIVTLAVLVAIEAAFAPHHHPVFPWHSVPGFQALLGVLSCLAVVKLSKLLGTAGLQRPEESGGED